MTQNSDKPIVRRSTEFLFDMWGLSKPTPVDLSVKVHTDLSRIEDFTKVKKPTYTDPLLEKEDMALNMKRKSDLGFAKSMEREQALTKLTNLIDVDGIETIQEALAHFPKIRNDRTIINYLKIIGRFLRDDKTGRMYGSSSPNYDSLYAKTQKPHEVMYRYYESDPLAGGKELTQEEYLAHRAALLQEAGLDEVVFTKETARRRRKEINDLED